MRGVIGKSHVAQPVDIELGDKVTRAGALAAGASDGERVADGIDRHDHPGNHRIEQFLELSGIDELQADDLAAISGYSRACNARCLCCLNRRDRKAAIPGDQGQSRSFQSILENRDNRGPSNRHRRDQRDLGGDARIDGERHP